MFERKYGFKRKTFLDVKNRESGEKILLRKCQEVFL